MIDPDLIVLYDEIGESRTRIPTAEIRKLEVFRGYDPSLENGVKDAGKGAAQGLVAGAALGLVSAAAFGIFGFEPDVGELVRAGAAEGIVAGGASGFAHGITVGSEVWEEVTFQELREEVCQCLIEEPVGTTDYRPPPPAVP